MSLWAWPLRLGLKSLKSLKLSWGFDFEFGLQRYIHYVFHSLNTSILICPCISSKLKTKNRKTLTNVLKMVVNFLTFFNKYNFLALEHIFHTIKMFESRFYKLQHPSISLWLTATNHRRKLFDSTCYQQAFQIYSCGYI